MRTNGICRDDVVFLIFLYQVRQFPRSGPHCNHIADCIHRQRWIYRIDPNRVNEYGQVLAADADAATADATGESKKDK